MTAFLFTIKLVGGSCPTPQDGLFLSLRLSKIHRVEDGIIWDSWADHYGLLVAMPGF